MKSWILLVALALLAACMCRPQVPQVEERALPVEGGDSGRTGLPAAEDAAEADPGHQPAADQEAEPNQATEARPAVEGGPETAPEQSFVVTEEVYNKTFDEVEEFIRDLNEIIRKRDFGTWLTYLSDEYKQRSSDPEYLEQQSEKPLLKKNNIRLRTLEDYFEYVVAPSRSQTTVDNIEFIDENHVKAISSIRGTRGILYHLVHQDGSWKIGVWD